MKSLISQAQNRSIPRGLLRHSQKAISLYCRCKFWLQPRLGINYRFNPWISVQQMLLHDTCRLVVIFSISCFVSIDLATPGLVVWKCVNPIARVRYWATGNWYQFTLWCATLKACQCCAGLVGLRESAAWSSHRNLLQLNFTEFSSAWKFWGKRSSNHRRFLFVRYNFKLNSLWVNWRAEHVFESTTNQETFDQCLQRLDAEIFLSSRISSVQYASLAPEGKFWPIFVCVHEWRYWKKFRSRDAPAYLYLAQRIPYVREVMWACKLSEVEVSIHKQKSRSIWVIQLRR